MQREQERDLIQCTIKLHVQGSTYNVHVPTVAVNKSSFYGVICRYGIPYIIATCVGGSKGPPHQ